MKTVIPTLIAGRIDELCRTFIATAAPVIKGSAADLLVLGGIGAIARGLSLWSTAAAWIFVGAIAIVIGLRGLRPTGGAQ